MCFGLSDRPNTQPEPSRPRQRLNESKTSEKMPRMYSTKATESPEKTKEVEVNRSTSSSTARAIFNGQARKPSTRQKNTTFAELARRGVIPKGAMEG